jgi:hypothetical protein
MAQSNVYSLNIVGYINVPVASGYNLIANQLNKGTNGINEVLPPTDATSVLLWNGSSFITYSYDAGFGGWIDENFNLLTTFPKVSPGTGFFYFNNNPAFTLTLVGDVATGTNTVALPSGYSAVASPVPFTGTLTAAPISMPQQDATSVLKWDGAKYITTSYDAGFGGWVDENFNLVPAPTTAPGQGFFFFNNNPQINWVQTFTP